MYYTCGVLRRIPSAFLLLAVERFNAELLVWPTLLPKTNELRSLPEIAALDV
jgi:hypothetical protein